MLKGMSDATGLGHTPLMSIIKILFPATLSMSILLPSIRIRGREREQTFLPVLSVEDLF